ncbi:DUF7691 family protein [Streptomyces sp. NPDC054855]
MSSCLSVYLLDVTATRALIGSRDDDLLTVIRERFSAQLTRADDEFADSIKESGAPTAFEALKAVVHGGPFSDENHAFQYGYAFERLCDVTGSFLNNSRFTPHRGDWLSVVDEGMAAMGITAVSVEDFWLGSLPSPLPRTHVLDCGQWTHEQCTKALEQFEAAKQAVDASGQAPPLEPEVVEAVLQCVGWLRHAVARPGHGVIGFRY